MGQPFIILYSHFTRDTSGTRHMLASEIQSLASSEYYWACHHPICVKLKSHTHTHTQTRTHARTQYSYEYLNHTSKLIRPGYFHSLGYVIELRSTFTVDD